MWKKRKLQKKRLGKWSKFFWVLPLFLIIVLSYLFLKSGIFTIKQVAVEAGSLSCATEKEIRNSANLLGQNFFLANAKAAEETLKDKFFCIKSAPVSRSFPDKVKIQALSRQPAAILAILKEKEASMSSLLLNIATPSAAEIKEKFKVDSEGVVFSKETKELNIPKIYIFDPGISVGKKLESNHIGNTLKLLEGVKTFRVAVSESWIYDNIFIVNSNASKLKILFRLDDQVDIQLASLQVILDKAKIDLKELEFIDLRFDKPIVRFAPKKVL